MRFKDLKNEKLSAFVEVPRAKIAQVAGKLGCFQWEPGGVGGAARGDLITPPSHPSSSSVLLSSLELSGTNVYES
jgi:hypothetical protein